MAYEAGAMVLSMISSVVLAVGLYLTWQISKRTHKATAVWSLFYFGFLTLFLYQAAEVLEYADKIYGESDDVIHRIFIEVAKVHPEDFAEGFTHTMPTASAAIFVCIAIVLRKAIIVPI
jgi:hypothetical protein